MICVQDSAYISGPVCTVSFSGPRMGTRYRKEAPQRHVPSPGDICSTQRFPCPAWRDPLYLRGHQPAQRSGQGDWPGAAERHTVDIVHAFYFRPGTGRHGKKDGSSRNSGIGV